MIGRCIRRRGRVRRRVVDSRIELYVALLFPCSLVYQCIITPCRCCNMYTYVYTRLRISMFLATLGIHPPTAVQAAPAASGLSADGDRRALLPWQGRDDRRRYLRLPLHLARSSDHQYDTLFSNHYSSLTSRTLERVGEETDALSTQRAALGGYVERPHDRAGYANLTSDAYGDGVDEPHLVHYPRPPRAQAILSHIGCGGRGGCMRSAGDVWKGEASGLDHRGHVQR